MKIIVNIFIVFFVLNSCSSPKEKVVEPELTIGDSVITSRALVRVIDKLITEDDSKISHKLFVVLFSNYKDIQYVTLCKTYYYEKERVDGYCFRNKELIMFYNVEKLKISGVLNKQKLTIFKDSIPHYLDISRCDMQFEVYPTKFQIISPDSLKLISENDSLSKSSR